MTLTQRAFTHDGDLVYRWHRVDRRILWCRNRYQTMNLLA